MQKMIVMVVALLVLTADTADAQRRAAPLNWVSGYGLMYTGISGFHDPGSNSDWVFDDNALGFGLGLQREVTSGLLLGADISYARPAYERRVRNTGVAIPGATGKAGVATALATGRIGYGGGADLGFYLSGGIGTIGYDLEDLGEWNFDFALRAGTGLEYRLNPSQAIYLEWGRVWGYHEKDGIGGGAAQHSKLQVGIRVGM